MTVMEQLYTALSGVAPAFYHKARIGQTVPYIAYEQTGSDNQPADDGVYRKVSVIDINLYTQKKDPVLEDQLETALDSLGLFYDKTESYLDDGDFIIQTYTVEILGG